MNFFLRFSRPRVSAFTLIELLTVIAIIGILAAILLPVVGRVREKARDASCISRHRQFASAILLHLNDNKNVLPDNTGNKVLYDVMAYMGQRNIPIWDTSGETYEGLPVTTTGWRSVWACPRTTDRKYNAAQNTYGYNAQLSLKRFSVIREPRKTAVFACISKGYSINGSGNGYTNPDPAGAAAGGALACWHSGGSNISFLDGHVATAQNVPTNTDPRAHWWSVNDPLAP